MSHLLDENDELLASPAREMTLGTGSILAIFFGLALLCALFFGFGYNVGHKSASAALLAPASDTPATSSASSSDAFSNFKPATKSSPAAAAVTAPSGGDEPTPAAQPKTIAAATPSLTSRPVTPSRPGSHLNASQDPLTKPSAASALPPHAAPSSPTPAATPTAATSAGAPGTFFVQIAAVSHPEDASMLMTALRARGYSVAERTEPADKLIHIQVGPFATKPSAEAMRQRLLADGYNAIIK